MQQPAEAEQSTNLTTYPSPEDFCLRTPLYTKFSFEDRGAASFESLGCFSGTLDLYCNECGQQSVFKVGTNDQEARYNQSSGLASSFGGFRHENYIFYLGLACSRDSSHQVYFIFRAHNGVLQKIGQYPSRADLERPDIGKYRSVLGKERHRELVCAIGLSAHGIGVGAFVYLRRIFEHLIEQAHNKAKTASDWDEQMFSNGRMDDKVRLLKNHLPDFLVDNSHVWKIMSKGVHALSDEECLRNFEVVLVAIELILDEELAKLEKENKQAAATKAISALSSQLGASTSTEE